MKLDADRAIPEAILPEKTPKTPHPELGQKYEVTGKYIERFNTKTQRLNISPLPTAKKIRTLQPQDFKEELTTVWSFKQRGNWATHSGEYRGNWSPYIPRNVILKYSQPGELVLDYFCGAGTTAVECKLLGRRCLALDINRKAVDLAKRNLDFIHQTSPLISPDGEAHTPIYEPQVLVGDARDLSFLQDNSVDLICAHPPYANIIHYTDSQKGDLSFMNIAQFLNEMSKVAQESFRVLKPGRQCAILIGDTRRKKHIVPLGFKLLDVYLNAGFKLRELVIKRQHNCKTTGFWYARSLKYNFLLLAHEYLPILEKPHLPPSVGLKGGDADVRSDVPAVKKPPLKREVDKLETTTVWVFPEEDWEERLTKNIVERYARGGGYLTLNLNYRSRDGAEPLVKAGEKGEGLLYIPSPLGSGHLSCADIEYYLKELEGVVKQALPNIGRTGFVVIQTRDVRREGYIEPLAKRVIDRLSFDGLWLKEIIVVTSEGQAVKSRQSRDYLEISHNYLLVYEVIR